MPQRTLWPEAATPADVVYTDRAIAIDIIHWLQPTGYLLDPCKGGGVFYDNFPGNCRRDYCEIQEGRDFFDWAAPVDWIIGNPPYSMFQDFLGHAFALAHDVCYIVPVNKVFQRWPIMDLIGKWGSIKAMRSYGPARDCGFGSTGFSVAAFHFQKGCRNPSFTWHHNSRA